MKNSISEKEGNLDFERIREGKKKRVAYDNVKEK